MRSQLTILEVLFCLVAHAAKQTLVTGSDGSIAPSSDRFRENTAKSLFDQLPSFAAATEPSGKPPLTRRPAPHRYFGALAPPLRSAVMYTTGEQIVIGLEPGTAHPVRYRLAGLLGDFELHRMLGLLLHDDRAGANSIAMRNVANAQLDQIASAQLAIDG